VQTLRLGAIAEGAITMKNSLPIDQLQDPATWDDESATVQDGVDDPKAAVSTRFSQQECECISKAAEDRGLSVSAYIRRLDLHHLKDSLPSTS
jgi:hypothetical protein